MNGGGGWHLSLAWGVTKVVAFARMATDAGAIDSRRPAAQRSAARRATEKTAPVRPARVSPGRLLLVGALVCVLVGWVCTFVALRPPWLGLALEPDLDAGVVRVVGARGPSADVPEGLLLVAVEGRPIHASDLVEEPDYLDTYPAMAALFARQADLAEALREPSVLLSLRDVEGRTIERRVQPGERPVGDLPPVYWFQLAAGGAALLIGLWVLVFRPREWSARAFAMMGATFPAFSFPAAIYSTRELALDAPLFRVLSSLNHAGAFLFGIALVVLFLSYPSELVRPRWLWIVPAIFVPWLATDVLRLAPDESVGHRIPILLQMLAAMALAVVQWRACRSDPSKRAALRWFGLSIVVGAGLFVFGTVASRLFGGLPPLPQGYSFGFFLLADVGLALGLRRFRLFELDAWAYRILAWVLGALALLALDAALVFAGTDPRSSFALSLLAAGFVYLPVRGWLWSKAVSRRAVADHELFRGVLQAAFATSAKERTRLWRSLLTELFDPLELRPIGDTNETAPGEPTTSAGVSVGSDGLALDVPAVAASPALRLAYPWRGRAMFAPRHVRLAEQLVSLMQHAEASRDAYDQGVREERRRIARDLHDDLGARLLGGLHADGLAASRQAIRHAIGDMRALVGELVGREVMLADALGELRHETAERLEAAGIALDWPADVEESSAIIEHRAYRSYASMLRELASNVIRHAHARRVSVRVACDGARIVTTFADDGVGFDVGGTGGGNGVRNVLERAAALGGSVRFGRETEGTRVVLELPLAPGASMVDA